MSNGPSSLLGLQQVAIAGEHKKWKVQTVGQRVFTRSEGSSLKGTIIMIQLLRSNSTKRLGVNGSSEIKAHPWFFSLDWSVVEARGLKMPAVMEMKGKAIKQ
jgi:hypothetical protein